MHLIIHIGKDSGEEADIKSKEVEGQGKGSDIVTSSQEEPETSATGPPVPCVM